MAASNEEIARDILVASLQGYAGAKNGKWLAEQYADLLKGVGQAVHDELQANKERYRNG